MRGGEHIRQEFDGKLQGELGYVLDEHPRIPAVWSICCNLNKGTIAIESGTWRYLHKGGTLFIRDQRATFADN